MIIETLLLTVALTQPAAVQPAVPTQQCIVEPRTRSHHCTFAPTRILHAEHRAARHPNAKDLEGWERSMYKGIWFDPTAWNERKCIMKRESNYRYKAKNPTSSASGAYQFLDSKWRDGLVWMMLDESKKTNDGLRSEIKKLRDKPITKWSRYFQDRAFYTAWRFGDGRHHWFHPGIKCY